MAASGHVQHSRVVSPLCSLVCALPRALITCPTSNYDQDTLDTLSPRADMDMIPVERPRLRKRAKTRSTSGKKHTSKPAGTLTTVKPLRRGKLSLEKLLDMPMDIIKEVRLQPLQLSPTAGFTSPSRHPLSALLTRVYAGFLAPPSHRPSPPLAHHESHPRAAHGQPVCTFLAVVSPTSGSPRSPSIPIGICLCEACLFQTLPRTS